MVQLIRASMRFVSYGDRKKVAVALKPVCTAANADGARQASSVFAAGPPSNVKAEAASSRDKPPTAGSRPWPSSPPLTPTESTPTYLNNPAYTKTSTDSGRQPAVGPGPAPGPLPGQPPAQRTTHDAQVPGDPTHPRPGVVSYRSTA